MLPFLAVFLVLAAGCSQRREQPRFQTTAGFSVEPAADPARTGSIVAFTFDSLGRPVVCKERKHPTLLLDSNNDGFFETEKVLTSKVHNLQGIWFDGRTMYAVGNNEEKQAGLYRLEDTNADDEMDTLEQLSGFEGGMGEHGPHDIRRGPDGLPTIMLGNHTSVSKDRVDPLSPLHGSKEWQLLERYMDARGHAAGIMAPGGTLVRWNEERRNFTLLAGGFRNAYNHAYNLDGEAFTFDSDMEWDINMPWYREVRTVHAAAGGDFGWRTGSGKFPAHYFDTLPPVRDLGRGSPVGVEFYQHRVYPQNYRDALIEGDWSRGRILVTNLVRNGANYRAAGNVPTEFVHGEPLNVTDVEVGPDGFLYFSTGGRDTEGGFYRLRYTPNFWQRLFRQREPEGLLAVVRQPQPLSSWGHEALRKAKNNMGARWGEELERLAQDHRAETPDRIQALLLLQRFGPKPKAEIVRPLSDDLDPAMRAAAVYVAGLSNGPKFRSIAAKALKDSDPLVRRRAAEALVRQGMSPDDEGFAGIWGITDDLYVLLADPDRFVRYAARLALERLPVDKWNHRVMAEPNPRLAMEGMLALIRAGAADPDAVLAKTEPLLRAGYPDALRLFAIAAAESRDGVREDLRRQATAALLPQFPGPDEAKNREIARVLAYCDQPESIGRILSAMPQGDANQPLQLHYVYCLRAMRSGWTDAQKTELVRWFQKASQWRGGASFTGFVNLMFDSALQNFTEEEKKRAWQRIPLFAPAEITAQMRERMEKTGWKATGALSRDKGVKAVSPQEILEWQMFDPMTLQAKPQQGRELFEKECASCHRFGPLGSDFGPDLTSLKDRFRKKDILEAILWPSKTISDQYESTIVETKDGDVVNGLLVREDANTVSLKTAEVVRPIVMEKAKIRARRKGSVSIMPEGLLDNYDPMAIAGLMAFLQAGGGSQ